MISNKSSRLSRTVSPCLTLDIPWIPHQRVRYRRVIRIRIQDLCWTAVEAIIIPILPELSAVLVGAGNCKECERRDTEDDLDHHQNENQTRISPAMGDVDHSEMLGE